MSPRPLIVRLRNWVGDVILGVPALQQLQARGFELQLVGKGWAGPLLAGEGWTVHTRPGGLRDCVAQLRELRRQARTRDAEFDHRDNAMVLPTSFSSALEMRLAGLKAVGYAQEGRSPLLQRSVKHNAHGEHALTSYWDLSCHFLRQPAEPPGAIGLKTLPADQSTADALLAAHGVRPGFVVICPFAGGLFEKQDKTWPSFAEFTRALLPLMQALGRDVVACPGPGEDAIVSGQHPGVTLLAGVRLGAYGALLRRAALVVSNDTGPAHLAAAVGAPVLSVLGPTKPEQWAPWGPTVEVIRRWPQWPRVDEVLERVRTRLQA
jgi:heptosyltransferase-2